MTPALAATIESIDKLAKIDFVCSFTSNILLYHGAIFMWP
jgi:hypothetical protein